MWPGVRLERVRSGPVSRSGFWVALPFSPQHRRVGRLRHLRRRRHRDFAFFWSKTFAISSSAVAFAFFAAFSLKLNFWRNWIWNPNFGLSFFPGFRVVALIQLKQSSPYFGAHLHERFRSPTSQCVELPFLRKRISQAWRLLYPGNTKGGSITVPLTSCLTGLD